MTQTSAQNKQAMTNIEINKQTAQLEKCLRILELIKSNKYYLDCLMRDSKNSMLIFIHGNSYYADRIDTRVKIHNRLTIYYAKNIAKLSSPIYEIANSLNPKKNNTCQTLN